jgi:serine/threonine-protein kinase HipA
MAWPGTGCASPYRDLQNAVRQLTRDHQEVLDATHRMIFNARTGNADDHEKHHSFLYHEEARQWTRSPGYDLTLDFPEGGDYQGRFPASFGSAPRLATMAETAAVTGVSGREFAARDDAMGAALRGWPEFRASSVRLPEWKIDHAIKPRRCISDSRQSSKSPSLLAAQPGESSSEAAGQQPSRNSPPSRRGGGAPVPEVAAALS